MSVSKNILRGNQGYFWAGREAACSVLVQMKIWIEM